MATAARDQYLAGKVMTATPQQRQLMLIDGAIRFAQQAKRQWDLGDDQAAGAALIRSQEIVCELLAARASAGTPLGRKASAVYVFIHRSLVEAHMQRQVAKVDDAVRILEIERETWQEVCRRLSDQGAAAGAAAAPTASPVAPPPSVTAADRQTDPDGSGGLPGVSFEA